VLFGHKNIQHTVRYTELALDRFKDFGHSRERPAPGAGGTQVYARRLPGSLIVNRAAIIRWHPRARPKANEGARHATDHESVNARPCSGCARFNDGARELGPRGVRCD
jgi:hypothetical protein